MINSSSTLPLSTVCDMFDARVRERPTAIAIDTPGQRWTYAELDRAVTDLASRLRRYGALPGTRIGLMVPRTPGTVARMLAVLRAGAAYLPIDPDEPAIRARQVLQDAACSLLIDEAGRVVELDGQQGPASTRPDWPDLAYVVHTSGSTGRPKPVAISHAALNHYVAAAIGYLRLAAERDRVLWTSHPAFDASVEELYPALCAGATVVMPDPAVPLARVLLSEAVRLRATVVPLPGAVLNALGHDLLPRLGRASVRLVVSGGSRLDRSALLNTPPELEVLNTYGPTEATVVVTTHLARGGPSGSVPIGRPIAGVRVYVLDRDLAPVSQGTTGELYVAGPTLAHGYLGHPGQTANVFRPDPFSPTASERMYATGDRVRERADGVLEFVGRIDGQVKIRGFRVELGEVEHCLRGCHGVREAAVVIRSDVASATALVAFVTGESVTEADLAAEVRERLPAYMVPVQFIRLAQMPIDTRGKIDRAGLASGTWPSGNSAQ